MVFQAPKGDQAVGKARVKQVRAGLVWACILISLASLLLATGFTRKIPETAPESAPSPAPAAPAMPAPAAAGSEEVAALCRELAAQVAALKWKLDPCEGIDWKVSGTSVKGRPLIYAEFGNSSSGNTTLVFSAVHGDEITPVYVGFKLVQWLREHSAQLDKLHVVVAPFVNPDGFFAKPKTRVNARGVDVNRNFATQDWNARAVAAWKQRYRSDPRRNPGTRAGSEPETLFQEELIRATKPQKLLSIHSPLNFMDYDGPSALTLARFPREYIQECMKLRTRLKAVPGGFFPGSLGNFAGRELGIPTLTLELPSADPSKAERYWQTFSQGIRVMIDFVVPAYTAVPWQKRDA